MVVQYDHLLAAELDHGSSPTYRLIKLRWRNFRKKILMQMEIMVDFQHV